MNMRLRSVPRAEPSAWARPAPILSLFTECHQQRLIEYRMGSEITRQRHAGTTTDDSQQPDRRASNGVKRWCQRHRREPLAWQHKELSSKLRGHYAYYGARGNLDSLARFLSRVWSVWRQNLRRRSQTSRKGRITALLNERFVLPQPRITHPDNWLPVDPGYLLGRAGCGKSARPAL